MLAYYEKEPFGSRIDHEQGAKLMQLVHAFAISFGKGGKPMEITKFMPGADGEGDKEQSDDELISIFSKLGD